MQDQEAAAQAAFVTKPGRVRTHALVETMPDQHRESHRAARNWGQYPMNGAVRVWMTIKDAEQAVSDDEDGYTSIVRYGDPER